MSDEQSARERWNDRYAAAAFEPFPDAPAPWLVDHRELLSERRAEGAARALDVACGDGRNARWLADLGFAVDAVDVSDVAVEALRSAAVQRGLQIDARVVDLERAGVPPGRWDVIVCFNYLQRDLLVALQGALAPGGLLLYETFAQAHIDELGRDFNPAYVLERNELLRSFDALYVRHYREGVVERGGGRRGLASIVAQRLERRRRST